MTAANHALTGAFIGLAVGNPWVAVPAAFISHFVCDAIPHYDVPGATHEARIGSGLFWKVQILAGLLLCMGIVAVLALLHPTHWLLAVICAFLATSPDLLAIPRFMSVRRSNLDIKDKWWFWRFHNRIQWFQKPIGGIVEIAWAIVMVALVRPYL